MSYIRYFDEIYVSLIAHTEIDVEECGAYLGDFGLDLPKQNLDDPQQLIEIAGRHCYMSFGKKAGKKTTESYIKNIIKQKHFSVLEHVSATFAIRGMSRLCSHELVRHRHLSFSQFSTRYCDDLIFVIPPMIRKDQEAKDEYLKICGEIYKDYKKRVSEMYSLLGEKIASMDFAYFNAFISDFIQDYDTGSNVMRKKLARGSARFYMLQGIEAPMVVTGNLRSWMEFIEKRDSPYADMEIKELARKIKEKLKEKFPFVFGGK